MCFRLMVTLITHGEPHDRHGKSYANLAEGTEN